MKASRVLIPGKFVVIHAGHIRLFRLARELGDATTIALDISDLHEDEIKWRISALSSMEYVDEVVTFSNDLSSTLSKFKPEIVLKGQEFASVINHEQKYIESYGGRLVFGSGSSFFSQDDLFKNNEDDLKIDFSKEVTEYLVRNSINKEKLTATLKKMQKIRTCLIGDLIVDEIINCHPIGMSQEDPTIVVTKVDSLRYIGGAGIVAGHCSALGSVTTFITVTGKDVIGTWSLSELKNKISNVVNYEDASRPTTLKQKFKSGKQVLMKLNQFNQSFVSPEIENKIYEYFSKNVKNIDLLILSDFSYGAISENLAQSLIMKAKETNIIVAADSQTSSQLGNLAKFKGADLVTPTEIEARLEMRDEVSGLAVLGENLRNKLELENVLLKMGPDGVLVHGRDQKNKLIRTDQVPALNKKPIDTSGAGDSMLASASLALAAGETLYMAAFIGSVMASIQVSRIGNIPISQEAIRNSLLM